LPISTPDLVVDAGTEYLRGSETAADSRTLRALLE
jgi:hypothetical protein